MKHRFIFMPLLVVFAVVFVIIFISGGFSLYVHSHQTNKPRIINRPTELLPDANDHTGICVTIHCAFYFGGVNAVYKRDAVAAAQHNNETDAATYLQWAIDTDNTDAEAKILKTNMEILKKPQHISAAVAVTLTSTDAQLTPEDRLEINAGLDTLQGAYIVQQMYNASHHDRQLVLEIVNLGSTSTIQASGSQQRLSQFLINEASKDFSSFLGVTGLPFNFNLANTFVDNLSSASIPMISLAPQTNVYTANYLVSIVPSLNEIAEDMASYIQMISPRVYVVYNKDSFYDSDLYTLFNGAFTSTNGFTTVPLLYSETSSQSDFASNADEINTTENTSGLKYPIVFIGAPEDAAQFYPLIQDKTTHIFGDDSLFDYVRLPESVKNQLNNMEFFAFAYEDQWQAEGFSSSPAIDQLYLKEYDPGNKHRGSYSFERTNDTVLLAYDALSLLVFAGDGTNPLPGCQNSQSSCPFTNQRCVLKKTIGISFREQQWEFIHACTFLGASGKISLRPSDESSPVNKELLILQIKWDQGVYGEVTQTVCHFGQFAQNADTCVEKKGVCLSCQ